MYTLEVAGKPIVIINAGSQDEADAIFHSDWFRRDLMAFETEDGDDLWNGSDELSVRQALPEEIAKFEEHQAKAFRNEGADHSAPYAVFLIPVSDALTSLTDVESAPSRLISSLAGQGGSRLDGLIVPNQHLSGNHVAVAPPPAAVVLGSAKWPGGVAVRRVSPRQRGDARGSGLGSDLSRWPTKLFRCSERAARLYRKVSPCQ